MIPTNPVPAVCNYGSAAIYRCLPSEEQIRAGVVPLDSLPAAWWNCMWFDTNRAINCARTTIGVLIDEVNSVLANAGVCVNPSCVDQLYQAINKMKGIIGNATTAGSVKSSSCPGEVSIDANGIMTANCVGNVALLSTSARTLTGAVNELKSTYDCCLTEVNNCLSALCNSKAPVNHASAGTTYGVGSSANYGHVKLSDAYCTCVGGEAEGIAASQLAVYCAYNAAMNHTVDLGNVPGCPLGVSSAGTALTASRSDHTHPAPECVETAGYVAAGPFANDTVCVYGTNRREVCNKTNYQVLIVAADRMFVLPPNGYCCVAAGIDSTHFIRVCM